jgi:malate dehydrogenase (oxaloacetate-decarboxylating)(NADP+)
MSAEEQLPIDALQYHEFPVPGKIAVAPTKELANQRDLSLAYSPGAYERHSTRSAQTRR